MEIKTGTKAGHQRHGAVEITESGMAGFTTILERSGKMEFSRKYITRSYGSLTNFNILFKKTISSQASKLCYQ